MKVSYAEFFNKIKILIVVIIFSVYYFFQLTDIPLISMLNIVYGVVFVLFSNLVYSLRIIFMRANQRLNFFEVLNYVNTINFINLFLPFRVGDSLYFIRNKKSVISLRDNYVFLVRIKFAELLILFLIFSYVFFGQFIYVKFILSLIVIAALFFNFKEVILSSCQVGIIWLFIIANLPIEKHDFEDFLVVTANYVLPIFDMFVFSFGDVVLNELGLLPLSVALSLRFYVAVGVVVTILGSKLYELKVI